MLELLIQTAAKPVDEKERVQNVGLAIAVQIARSGRNQQLIEK